MDTYSHIGFTGTSLGMTDLQRDLFEIMLKDFDGETLHHGDCVGSDEQAHNIAYEMGYLIYIYPPINKKLAANLRGYINYVPREYLERNRMIVRATDLLIATPNTSTEMLRSGTWSTIRYARKLKKHICIIYPDGTSEGEM